MSRLRCRFSIAPNSARPHVRRPCNRLASHEAVVRDAWGHRFVQQRGCEKCVRDYVARCTANGGAITAEPWALPVEAR